MSVQFFEKALAGLKKANKVRKLKLATDAGFSTVESYQEFLENSIKGSPQVTQTATEVKPPVKRKPSVKKETPKIIVVDILDASVSMRGLNYEKSKISMAKKGIETGLENLKNSKEDVEYHYGFCAFSRRDMYEMSRVGKVNSNLRIGNFEMGGATALYDAIGKTINNLIGMQNSQDYKDAKFLINIYTDGEENDSRTFTASQIKTLIARVEKKGFTITFVGTDNDVKEVQRKINIDSSNTLSYDGTGQGMQMAMQSTLNSRMEFSAKVTRGEDVSKGFYKNIKK